MRTPGAKTDWFERGVAVAYSTVAVLGIFVVVLTVSLYLPGVDRGSLPIP